MRDAKASPGLAQPSRARSAARKKECGLWITPNVKMGYGPMLHLGGNQA